MHANQFLTSTFVSHRLKVLFNLNQCIVKSYNGEAITIVSCEGNLHKINFMKVHEAYATKLVQTPTGDGERELWHLRLSHLNVKDVHTLQNMVSGIPIGKFSYPISSLEC